MCWGRGIVQLRQCISGIVHLWKTAKNYKLFSMARAKGECERQADNKAENIERDGVMEGLIY